MEIKINDKGKIELDMWEIVNEIVGNCKDEPDLEEIISAFGWQRKMFAYVAKQLAEEYSRPCFNELVHIERDKFLKSIKQEELNYFASKIASIIEEDCRHKSSYWGLYHYCSENDVFRKAGVKGFYNDLKIDFDLKHELEKTIIKVFTEKFPELKESGVLDDNKD